MKNSKFSTDMSNFEDLHQKGRSYKVPLFQRDYSWDKQQWSELWEDLTNGINNNDSHYLGAILLLTSNGEKDYFIIDGQQRLTTLSIIILAIISNFDRLIDDDEIKKSTIEEIKKIYIGEKTLRTMYYKSKLVLNTNNKDFYSTYLVESRDPTSVRTLPKTNRLLYNCLKFFKEKIKTYSLEQTWDLYEFVIRQLTFIEISSDDDINAYTIFETLNDRGLSLSVTDLLKNHLLSLTDDGDIKKTVAIWDNIISFIQYENFPTFLRHYWSSIEAKVTKKELYKVIKKNITSSRDSFVLLKSLQEIAPIYSALSDDKSELWNGDQLLQHYVYSINLFGVKQCYSIMLQACLHMSPKEKKQVFKLCSLISFRYNIISKYSPSRLEEIYSSVAIKISKKEYTNAGQVYKELEEVYIKDDEFSQSFKNAKFSSRSKNIAKYILHMLEDYIIVSPSDIDFSKGTLEHILPQNPNKVWLKEFSEPEQYIWRLGNLCLLEFSLNNEINNKPFNKKITSLKQSKFIFTNSIDEQKWTQDEVNKRQSELAKIAMNIWKF